MMTLMREARVVLQEPRRLHGGLEREAAGGGVPLGVLELVAELEHGVAEQRDGVGQLGRRGPVAADRAERAAGEHARVAHGVVHLLRGLGVERHALARAPRAAAQGERLARQRDRVEEVGQVVVGAAGDLQRAARALLVAVAQRLGQAP